MYSEPIVTHTLQHCILIPIPMAMHSLSQVEGFPDILTQLGLRIRRDGGYRPLLVCVFPKGAFTWYLHSSFGHAHAQQRFRSWTLRVTTPPVRSWRLGV
jgi:hypothetical protein